MQKAYGHELVTSDLRHLSDADRHRGISWLSLVELDYDTTPGDYFLRECIHGAALWVFLSLSARLHAELASALAEVKNRQSHLLLGVSRHLFCCQSDRLEGKAKIHDKGFHADRIVGGHHSFQESYSAVPVPAKVVINHTNASWP